MIPLGVLAQRRQAAAGGGGISPDSLTGQDLWWRCDLLSQSNGTNINPVADSFGLGNLGPIGGYLKFYSNQINGLPAGRGLGGNESYLRSSGLHQMRPNQTHIYVVKPAAPIDIGYLFHRVSSGWSLWIGADSKWTIGHDGVTPDLQVDAVVGQWQIVTFRIEGTALAIRINGVETTGTGPGYDGSTTLYGMFAGTNSGNTSFDGDIAEAIRYDAAHTAADIAGVEAYLAGKFGITIGA